MKTVIFRTDGNKTIGMGHVTRCLALASAFFNSGYRVVFAMSDDSLQNKVQNHGFNFVCVNSRFDDYSFHPDVFFEYVKATAPSIVVVDNYSVSSKYLLQIHNITKVLYISEDYKPEMVNAADYFVNYNIYMNSITPIQADGVQMLGTQFTLLREEFAKPLRNTVPERKTITVFTGGSDLLNVAPELVQQLVKEECLLEYQILVVSGDLNPNIPRLITLANRFNRVTIAIEPSSISDIMDNTSIAVSSGGSILYELRLAIEKECESVAFPLISSGVYGYPKDQALRIAVDAITSVLVEHDMLVYIVVFDKASFQISEKLFTEIASYIDDKYVDTHFKFNRIRRDEFDESTLLAETCIFPNEEAFDLVAPSATYQQSAAMPKAASLEDMVKQIDESFSEMLLRKIDEKGMTDSQCYKKANVDRKLFSKIRSDSNYHPSKTTAIAFAIALKLSLEETKDMLMKAGFALSHSNKFDIIIEYFITSRNYNVFEINEALFAFDQTLLGV